MYVQSVVINYVKVNELGEPLPPGHHQRLAEHHWLDAFDIDGHFKGTVVLQFNPAVKRWSHSGDVGTGIYVNTKYWKYRCPCPMPDIN